MSRSLQHPSLVPRSDWILPPPDHPVCWERRPERSRSPPPRAAPGTPPGPPPRTPPDDVMLRVPMTPPELLGSPPGTPDSVWICSYMLMTWIQVVIRQATKETRVTNLGFSNSGVPWSPVLSVYHRNWRSTLWTAMRLWACSAWKEKVALLASCESYFSFRK